tara:strand:+ start:612 stop:926 length:315 start_codon:yes stop_codon:yes gene_type:complete
MINSKGVKMNREQVLKTKVTYENFRMIQKTYRELKDVQMQRKRCSWFTMENVRKNGSLSALETTLNRKLASLKMSENNLGKSYAQTIREAQLSAERNFETNKLK